MNGIQSDSLSGDRARSSHPRGGLGGRLVMGLLLLTLGLLWTLDNLRVIEAGNAIRWWPVLLVFLGLCRVTGILGPQRPISGAFWFVLGGLLLLRPFGILSFDLGDLWPLALIFVGALFIYRSWVVRSFESKSADGRPVLDAFAILGGVERKVVSQEFRGGNASAVLGGTVVDLRSCRPAEGRAVVEATAFLGGVEILVPEGWRVIGEVTPILGGFEDATVLPTDPNAPVLLVRGLAIMGGIDVKNARSRDRSCVRVSRRRGPHGVDEEIEIDSDGVRVRRERRSDPDD